MAPQLAEESAATQIQYRELGEEGQVPWSWNHVHEKLACRACDNYDFANLGEGLLLGACDIALCPYRMQRLGITHVMQVMDDVYGLPWMFEGFQYMTVDVKDYPEEAEKLAASFEDAFAFISEGIMSGEGKVYVHCLAGISRSSTVCLAYLMKNRRLSLDEAKEHVRRVRPQIDLNSGFEEQLKKFEYKLRELRQECTIDATGERIAQAAAEVVAEE